MRRRILSSVTLLGLAAASVALAAPATAAPAAPCSGTVCLTLVAASDGEIAIRGDNAKLDYRFSLSSGQAHVSFSSTQSADLAPDPASVQFDGTAVPRSAVTIAGDKLTVDLTAVNPVSSATGHQLTYNALVSATAGSDPTSTGTVVFDDTIGGAPASATVSQTLDLNKPDLRLTAEPAYGKVTAGNPFYVGFDAYGDPSVRTDLVITVPHGFSFVTLIDSSDQKTQPCSVAGSTVTCKNLPGYYIRTYEPELRPNATDRPGTVGRVSATMTPVGIADANPADNTAHVDVTVTGTVALKVGFGSPYGIVTGGKLSPLANLPVGKATPVTVTVTNQGPSVATGVSARLVLESNTGTDFTIGWGPAMTGTQAGPHTFAVGQWTISRLAVGQTASSTVTITPSKVGDTGSLIVTMSSVELNTLECGSRACIGSAGVALAVQQHVDAVTTASTSAGPSAGGSELANTGGPVRAPLIVGLIALLSGAVLSRAARRRPSAR